MRMSQETFDELFRLIEPHIEKKDTNMRRCIPAEERLIITLKYLATGCLFKDLHYTFQCGTSTAQEIVFDVCEKILQHLSDICIPELTEAEWLNIAAGFETRANFPNCLGAIDSKHIKLIHSAGSVSTYFNYKKYFSMVLLAVCDSNYRFTYIDTGFFGKASDSSIFKDSAICRKITANTFNTPKARPLFVGGDPLPYTLIGDEAFGLSTYILRPYAGKDLSRQTKIFNYRLSRAMRYIECSFGILSNKWRISHRPFNVNTINAELIMKVCCTLHNFVRERDGVDLEHKLQIIGLHEDNSVAVGRSERSAISIRETFTEYFCSVEGSVPLQENSM
nr:unnamed protein product [Callosobruchus chinensis]